MLKEQEKQGVHVFDELNHNSQVKAALYGYHPNIMTFAIGTSENPMGQEPKDNNYISNKNLRGNLETDLNQRTDKLGQDLSRGGWNYQKIRGKYNDIPEHSYIIWNISLRDAKNLFKRYNQESFVFAHNLEKDPSATPNMVYEFWKRPEGGDYKLAVSKENVNSAKDAEDMFSRLNEFKWVIPFFESGVQDFPYLSKTLSESDRNWMLDYLDGKKVGMSSYYIRSRIAKSDK